MKTTIKQKQGSHLQLGVTTSGQFGRRNWLLLAACAIGLLAAASGRAQQVVYPLPFYEPFPCTNTPFNGFGYGNNEELGVGANDGLLGYPSSSSNVWSFGNSLSSSCARAVNTNGQSGLQYPGLTNVDAAFITGALALYGKNTSSTKDRAVALAIPVSSSNAPLSLYASCLINIQTNTFSGASPFPFFGLTQTGTSSVNHAGALVYLNNALQLQVSKNSVTTAATTPTLISNYTYLIVLRYKFNPGTNDEMDLWVDPTALGSNVTVPPPTLTTTNGNNLATNFFGAVGIFEGGNPPQMIIDEIRVATNWGGVTPTFPPPGNSYAVTGGGAGCGDTSFDVALNGSDSGVTYYLYTNGIPTGISVNGTGSAIDFGSQTTTALYTVAGSNTTSGFQGWMNGGAAVTILSPPTITTQPLPLTVPSGELGAFIVGSSGGGQTYQWYRGGVALTNAGEFSDVQTSNLVIFPVTSADAANTNNGYYVVISNACGTSVTSVTNALTLGAPASVVWYGDNNSNFWDVSVSENWNTNSSYFNYGDNVTFGDIAYTGAVTLNNSFLSPSTITVDAAGLAYTFSGPGGLAGSGSIIMNGGSSLTLTVPNTETGGIIISNGTVSFNNAGNLGAGIITLAGGELAAGNVGLVDVDNEIDVTSTNSAIGISATGGQPLVLTNILNGISGNLTFVDNATKSGSPAIELTYPNIAFNLPVNLNVGTGGGLILGDYNTSGVHAWENIISGAGQIQRNAAGGQTVLEATNTYSGGTILTSGQLGVATNSVFISGGLVSGPLGTGNLIVDTRTSGVSPQLFASGGPVTLGNSVTWYSNVVGPTFVIFGSNELSFTGGVDMDETNRTIEVSNTVSAVFSNTITDDGYVSAMTVTGTGALYLDGANIYTGATTNSASLLAGTGSVQGPVVVQPGATLGAGDPAGLGTFTIDNSLTLGGNLFFRVNKSLSQSNDAVVVTGGATNVGSGTVTVSNLGPAFAVGNRFVLFSAPLVGGGTLAITGGGVTWTNNLALDGSISVLSLTPPPPPPSPSIVAASASGGNLVFSGTNGTVGGTYYVITTTNIALPLADWTAVSTNTFGIGGVFSVTNPISGGTPSMYFGLKIGQ